MTNRLMISVAAIALVAGTGLANAQGTGMGREGSSGGSTVQQSAPQAGSAGAMSRESTESAKPSSGMKATQSDEKSGIKSTQSEEKMQPGGSKNLKGEKSAQDNMQGQKSKSMSSENDNARDSTKGGKDMKAEGREGRNGNMNAESREGRDRNNMNAEQKSPTDTRSQTTTGQAGGGAKLSTEQRTKITTVIRSQHVAPVNNVDFSISIGTRVPRERVSFRPLPAEVVTIYPEWRGYEFFLVRDQIVVVDPRTLEIVAVLEA